MDCAFFLIYVLYKLYTLYLHISISWCSVSSQHH